MKIDFDSIVKAAAATINEKDVQFAQQGCRFLSTAGK